MSVIDRRDRLATKKPGMFPTWGAALRGLAVPVILGVLFWAAIAWAVWRLI